MRQSVTRESAVSIYVDVLSVSGKILVLGESPVHHGVPRDVVALVGLDQEVQPDIVEARKEVESVPGTLSGSLLARTDLLYSGVLQVRFGEERVGEDCDCVDGRSTVDISRVG